MLTIVSRVSADVMLRSVRKVDRLLVHVAHVD